MFWPLPFAIWLALSAGAQQVAGAAVIAAAATTFVARRLNSGSVRTADASTIFQAGETIRKELRDEVVELRGEVKVLRHENGELRDRVVLLEAEVARLGGVIDD
jgi:hypothetical protein